MPSNNISILPFYGSPAEQNARKWWIYDRVYPLYTPGGHLPPFQITREARTSDQYSKGNVIVPYDYFADMNVTVVGGVATFAGQEHTDISNYAEMDFPSRIYLSGLPPIQEEGDIFIAACDGDDVVIDAVSDLSQFDWYEVDGDGRINAVWTLPEGATSLYVVTMRANVWSPGITRASVCEVETTRVIRPIEGAGLCFADGADAPAPVASLLDSLRVVNYGAEDVIIFDGLAEVFAGRPIGQFYLWLTDGVQTWFSDVFTAVGDIDPYLKLEWWDDSDFVMDAGRIVYDGAFRNILYLASDIAKPEYTFEEEGESRDGYFFPTKQISAKKYRFSFFASEYLLDVMRFVRMADHAQITKGGQVYPLTSFLITPEWEENGDVAAVSAEFETATVAKKIGSFLK